MSEEYSLIDLIMDLINSTFVCHVWCILTHDSRAVRISFVVVLEKDCHYKYRKP